MHNQHRLLRLFQLIHYLQAPSAKRITQLQRLLDTSERTIYRYLDLLKEAGFAVQKDTFNRYFIAVPPEEVQVPFTTQEADYLIALIRGTDMRSPIAQSLLHKASRLSTQTVVAKNIFQAHKARIIEQLGLAIVNKKQVKLLNYASAHSQQISDRLVEPNRFTDNYTALAAYELDSHRNKYFSIQRIGGIDILETNMQHEAAHEYHPPDMFGFQGTAVNKEVSWTMNLRAMLLLKQMHPLTANAIREESEGQYSFAAMVESFMAPASFVLGLPDDIQVTGSAAFLEFIQDKRG